MIKIIDTTLTTLDKYLLQKNDLYEFCRLLTLIGVEYIELSKKMYDSMGKLPEGLSCKFLLHADNVFDLPLYEKEGFYRFIYRHADGDVNIISEYQVNDIREIVQLKAHTNTSQVRIVGLDDMLCKDYVSEMNEIRKIFKRSEINFCPENTYKCATALAVQWILSGGKSITTSFCGSGNKASTEEVIMALRLAIRHKPNRDLSVLRELAALFEQVTGTTISSKKSIIGKDIFKIEAGIHADAVLKNPATYEAYDPSIVGGKTTLVLGKHSGRNAVRRKLLENSIPIQDNFTIEKILKYVQGYSIQNSRSLTDEEFVRIARGVIMNERKKAHY